MNVYPGKRSGLSAVNPVRRAVVIWLGVSMVGAAVLALPDDDSRLFSFSETHGPSAIDLVGMVALLAAWVPVARLLWSERSAIKGGAAFAAGGLALAGAVLLVVTIGFDLGAWWLVAVALLLAAQLVALGCIARRRAPGTWDH